MITLKNIFPKKQNLVYEICIALLILLWSYTAFSKIIEVNDFRNALNNKIFSTAFSAFLIWFIPTIEITAAFLLIFMKTRFIGLLISTSLMFVFTVYIALVLFGYFEKTPCSCGGVIQILNWKSHLWFNLLFLVIATWACIIHRKIRT